VTKKLDLCKKKFSANEIEKLELLFIKMQNCSDET